MLVNAEYYSLVSCSSVCLFCVHAMSVHVNKTVHFLSSLQHVTKYNNSVCLNDINKNKLEIVEDQVGFTSKKNNWLSATSDDLFLKMLL